MNEGFRIQSVLRWYFAFDLRLAVQLSIHLALRIFIGKSMVNLMRNLLEMNSVSLEN